jgi:hypothetical protein
MALEPLSISDASSISTAIASFLSLVVALLFGLCLTVAQLRQSAEKSSAQYAFTVDGLFEKYRTHVQCHEEVRYCSSGGDFLRSPLAEAKRVIGAELRPKSERAGRTQLRPLKPESLHTFLPVATSFETAILDIPVTWKPQAAGLTHLVAYVGHFERVHMLILEQHVYSRQLFLLLHKFKRMAGWADRFLDFLLWKLLRVMLVHNEAPDYKLGNRLLTRYFDPDVAGGSWVSANFSTRYGSPEYTVKTWLSHSVR